MKTFVDTLVEHNLSNRQIGFIENGTWAPIAGKIMKGMLENCKNLTFIEPTVKILSSVTEENINQIESLAKELCK
jgi:flavorubredoxin